MWNLVEPCGTGVLARSVLVQARTPRSRLNGGNPRTALLSAPQEILGDFLFGNPIPNIGKLRQTIFSRIRKIYVLLIVLIIAIAIEILSRSLLFCTVSSDNGYRVITSIVKVY
ncbi:hypothetical protein [Scytonema sp. NUACC26]|uniref:hypothetical protein n=1 Tax=Scytonema sp. NUACC26 TaxID=3140176 RepID=UPI0038B2892E